MPYLGERTCLEVREDEIALLPSSALPVSSSAKQRLRMMSGERETYDSAIDPVSIKIVVHQYSITTIKIPRFHTIEIDSYAEFRTRDTLDIFDGAVGGQ